MQNVEEIQRRLREAGGRLTQPRRAVIEALVSAGDHPTADDLAEHVARAHPSVHRSTVYRTLDVLAGLGLVEHVHLGHGRAVYHLTGDDDLHLLCEQCGLVVHVDGSLFDTTRSAIEDATGFVLHPGHFALPGTCAGCHTSDVVP